MRYRYKRPFHMSDCVPVSENKKQEDERVNDRNERREIQRRIRELKQLGFPKDQAIERLYSDFPDSEYKGFFESWIENTYGKEQKSGTNREDLSGR